MGLVSGGRGVRGGLIENHPRSGKWCGASRYGAPPGIRRAR